MIEHRSGSVDQMLLALLVGKLDVAGELGDDLDIVGARGVGVADVRRSKRHNTSRSARGPRP